MSTRKSNPSLLYTHGTPSRWLQAAVAMLDDSLGTLCAKQWQCAQPVTIMSQRAPRLNRRQPR